jgi:hypothetical protein
MLATRPCFNKALLDTPQARDGALLEVEELRHEVADLRRMASPHKALRMSRSDSEDEDPLAEQVGNPCRAPCHLSFSGQVERQGRGTHFYHAALSQCGPLVAVSACGVVSLSCCQAGAQRRQLARR